MSQCPRTRAAGMRIGARTVTTSDHPFRHDVWPLDRDTPEGFDAFLRQHERWARRYLRRLLDGNDHDIEDALQDVCLRLWRSWPPTTSPRGLLATVVRHVAVDFTRTKQFSQARVTDPLGDIDPPGSGADPLDEVVLMEQRTAVREALCELPMDQRRLLFDRHHCATPFSVLADEHGTTSTALRSKEGRVLRKLRNRLADSRTGMPILLLRADMHAQE